MTLDNLTVFTTWTTWENSTESPIHAMSHLPSSQDKCGLVDGQILMTAQESESFQHLILMMYPVVNFTFVCTSAIRCAIQKRLKLLSTVGEFAGTYREWSQDLRGLYLQLVDTISSQLHTVADVRRHLFPRYVTAVPPSTTLQITLWIKRKSLFWTSRFKPRNSQHTGNWRLQYSHQVAWQIHSL